MPRLPIRRRPLRPRRKAPIPRNGARRARSPQPPRAVELFFIAALKRIAAGFAQTIGKILYPRVADFAKPEVERTDRLDAPEEDEDDLEDLVTELRDAASRAFDEESVRSVTTTAAKRTVIHSQHEFKRIGIGIKKEPNLGHLINGWNRDIVDRIKGAQSKHVDRIHEILTDGYSMRYETLAKRLEEQLEDVTESRAESIARTAVLSLNGKITRERQTAAGIEQYVWTTSSDERVRDEHEVLDGETFSWEDGDPEEGHPGEAPNCRCIAFPILDELNDVDDEAEAAE